VELLLSLGIATIVMFGGVGVLNGSLLIGTLVAFILYIQNFFDPIRSLTMEYAQLQIATASGARIFELLDVKPEISESPDSIRPDNLKGEIIFENVSFSYDQDIEVLHNIDLHITPESTLALVGPTGAGKSTVINLIARFYDVTQGRILVDGVNLRQIDLNSYRKKLGLVLQEPFLFSGTIKENIRYGNLVANDEEIIFAAMSVGAHEFIIHLEKGYDTELQERGQNLSMGQRQLISFARALIANPAILLLDEATASIDSYSELDEATASIDSYSENIIQRGLKQLKKGRTTIIIAHRLSTIVDADLIVVMDHGRIIEAGRHSDLLEHHSLYRRLYEMAYAQED